MMTKYKFNPLANESDVLSIGELSIENRLDRVSVFGNVDITRDKDGLRIARELKSLFERVVDVLQSETLPDHVQTDALDTIANPFQSQQ
jgi:hypothetical protein